MNDLFGRDFGRPATSGTGLRAPAHEPRPDECRTTPWTCALQRHVLEGSHCDASPGSWSMVSNGAGVLAGVLSWARRNGVSVLRWSGSCRGSLRKVGEPDHSYRLWIAKSATPEGQRGRVAV